MFELPAPLPDIVALQTSERKLRAADCSPHGRKKHLVRAPVAAYRSRLSGR